MKSGFRKKSSFHPNHLSVNHVINFKYHSDTHLPSKHKKDENEQKLFDFISDKEKFKIKPYFNQKEFVDFLSSKFKAMEKMNLDDECHFGKIEIKKINIDKNIFPKLKQSKNKNKNFSPQKKRTNKNFSKEKPKNKSNNKNITINENGKIEKSSMKSIDLIDEVNFYTNKDKKGRELNQLFSNTSLLASIINEMKGK